MHNYTDEPKHFTLFASVYMVGIFMSKAGVVVKETGIVKTINKILLCSECYKKN